MRPFLRNILIIACLWFAIDRTAGLLLSWANWHSNDYKISKINHIVTSADADILLIGTSRCAYHYVSSIISDSTGMSVYNAGIEASNNIFSNYMVLAYVLQHHTPKIVCLDTGESEFAATGDNFEPLNIFAPHYGECERADSVFALAGKGWKYTLSHLYRYHSHASQIIVSQFTETVTDEHGFLPLPKPSPESILAEKDYPRMDSCVIDSGRVAMFRSFIELCQEKHITLVLSISPSLAQMGIDYYRPLRDIAMEYGIVLLDYDTTNYLCDRPCLFRDAAHLSGAGARLFTTTFASDLRKIITPSL